MAQFPASDPAGVPAFLPAPAKNFNGAMHTERSQAGQVCNTNTFYMRLPAPAGEKIEISRLQTFPDGNYLAAGTSTLGDGSKTGLLVVLAPDGSIIRQQQFRIENKPVTISDAGISLKGDVYVTGIINDGSNAVFLTRLKEDFSVTWNKTSAQPGQALKVRLGLVDQNTVALAVQLPGSIAYSLYSGNGSLRWGKNLAPASLTDLVGFNSMSSRLGIVTNCLNSGLQLVQIFEIDQNNGNLLATSFNGDGLTESKAMAVTPFNSRLNILGVTKDGPGVFTGFRNNIAGAANAETVHRFTTAEPLDFSTNAAMDNAGDALGYFLPARGELLFVKHFSYYTTATEFARKYPIANGTSVGGITRSLDGGFLFGINTIGAGEVILMKTDSLGLLAVCGQQTANVTSTETIGVQNKITTATAATVVNTTIEKPVTLNPAAYAGVFDCRQNYCPPDPVADTCLSTYYKTFRSGSYLDLVRNYCMLKNNKQLLATVRYDRTYGNLNQLTYGLELLDERGALLQAKDIYNDTASQQTIMWKMDDSQVMLLSYSPTGGNQRQCFTLIDDNLVKKWSKTIVTYSDFFSAGVGIIDMHKDQEGNFYAIGTRAGFPPINPAVFIYKMDPSGNHLWTKAYETPYNNFGTACITSTPSGVVIVIEAGSTGGLSLRLDKTTGQLLNSYKLPPNWAGSIYLRLLRYDAGRIFYAGSQADNFLMGVLDTTGRPLRFRYASAASSVMRSATVKDGNLYATFNYFDGSAYKEVLLKADTALNINFINQYDMERYRTSRGLAVSDAGNIYSCGSFFYGGLNAQYGEDYIIKYGPLGETGTCNYQAAGITFTDNILTNTPVVWTPILRTYPEDPFSISLVNSNNLLNVSNVLCSSLPQCTFVQLTDPGPVCRLNVVYPIRYKKDINCTLRPQWQYDTSAVDLRGTTDSTGLFSFKKPGASWIKAGLNAGCLLFTDSLLLNVQSTASALSLGRDTIMCSGDSVALHAGPGFANYTWQDGSADSNYTVRQAGKYFVQVSNACAETSSDTIVVLPAIVPTLYLGPDLNTCAKDSVTLTAPPAFALYNWQPALLTNGKGSMVKVATPADTSITLEAKTSDGCAARDTVRITLLFARAVNLGADTSFCETDSVRLDAGNGYLQYAWSNGSTAQVVYVKKAASYQVTVTDMNGCNARDTLIVSTTFPTPVVALGPDRDLCAGQQLQLDAGKYVAYNWNDGTTSRTLNVSAAGLFSVRVTDSHQCTASGSIVIKNINPLLAGFLRQTDTVCNYGKLTIVPSKTYNTYQWSDGSFQPTTTIASPGWYSLTVTDNNGCKGSDSILIIKKECLTGFFVPSAFSPNGDQRNDAFRALVYGPVTHFYLEIFNRFGQQVFSSTDPQQAWNGLFKGKPCDTGNYIWQCHYQFEAKPPVYEKGAVMLVR